jgi:hypothetical protein
MNCLSTVFYLLAIAQLSVSVLMCNQCSDKNPKENGVCATEGELRWGGCRTYFQPCVTIIGKDKKVEKVSKLAGNFA